MAVASFASCMYLATVLPVNSVSVTTPVKKILYTLGIWGAKSFFFMIWGLSPPSPYVEPPLLTVFNKRNCIVLYCSGGDLAPSLGERKNFSRTKIYEKCPFSRQKFLMTFFSHSTRFFEFS